MVHILCGRDSAVEADDCLKLEAPATLGEENVLILYGSVPCSSIQRIQNHDSFGIQTCATVRSPRVTHMLWRLGLQRYDCWPLSLQRLLERPMYIIVATAT